MSKKTTTAITTFFEKIIDELKTAGKTVSVEKLQEKLASEECVKTLTKIFEKKMRKKDPNAPKKPKTAYIYFCQDHRETVKSENPDLAFGDIAKKLSARWIGMTPKQKKPYEEKAAQDKARYDEQMKKLKKPSLKTAYTHFSIERRPKLTSDDLSFADVSKILSEEWAKIKDDPAKRAKYDQMVEKARPAYIEALAQWEKDNPDKVKPKKGKAKKTVVITDTDTDQTEEPKDEDEPEDEPEPEEDEKTEEDLEDEPTPVANNIRDFIKDNIDRVCKDIKSKNPKMPQAKIHGAAMVELQKLWQAKNMK